MTRERPGLRNRLRERIAQAAARMIAEDGIADYAVAKRKAARLLGGDDRDMPGNGEVEAALRAHQALYQADEAAGRLRALRRTAVAAMRLLLPFDPHLTGSVLTGLAGRHSDINLQLFPDSPKDVELHLIGARVPYRPLQKRFHVAGVLRPVPVLAFVLDGVEIEAAVFDRDDARHLPRVRQDGTAIQRARLQQVEALLDD